MALENISSSIQPIDPKGIFFDGYELSNQSIIPNQLYSGSFTPGLNNIEFYIYSQGTVRYSDYNFTNYQAILLGSDQGRKVYSKKLNSLVERYSLTKKVKFINHCKEMPLAYSLADVVVSASVEPEAFGRVAVESQSMGKPIIASNIGGSKETILNRKSGFLYKHDDPRELAKNLNTVIQLSQEQLKLMGNEGRKNITKKFDVEVMCDSNLREYKKLLKN